MRIIINPSLYLSVEHIRYVAEVFVRFQLQFPSPYLFTYGFLCFLTDCRQEACEKLPIPVLCVSWSECISQKIKGYILMVPFSVIIFTVHNPCLLLVQFQTKTSESLFQPPLQILCLLLGDTVRYPIICVSCPRNRRKFLYHEIIKHIVQKQICQYRAYHAALRRSRFPFYDCPIFHLERRRQPSLDVQEYPLLLGVFLYHFHEITMPDVIEQPPDIKLQYPVFSPTSFPCGFKRLYG